MFRKTLAVVCLSVVLASLWIATYKNMPIIKGKDNLLGASNGELLTAHTPSGAGATGGAWVDASGSAAFLTLSAPTAGAGFKQTGAGKVGSMYLNGSGAAATAQRTVQAGFNYPNDTAYMGVGLVVDNANRNYIFERSIGGFICGKDGGGTLYTPAPSATFATATPYVLEMTIDIVAGNAVLNCYLNGTLIGGPYTDSTSPYLGTLYGAIWSYDLSATATSFQYDLASIAPDVTADNAGFFYSGRWGSSGTTKKSITIGSEFRFAYTGNSCTLCFDTSGNVHYPGLAIWVDGVLQPRVTLDSSGNVTITPAYNTAPSGTVTGAGLAAPVRSNVHKVRVMVVPYSGYPVAVDNWTTQTDIAIFLGVNISGNSLLAAPSSQDPIEFLGDSITGSGRLTFTASSGDGVAVWNPEIGWPEYVARELNLTPIVTGHGGQGITTVASDSTPVANSAFGFVYSGTAWNPTYKPRVVVVYHGFNDTTFSAATYQAFLTTIRTAYPAAWIFAVVPFQVTGTRQTSIQTAVANLADPRIVYLDYSTAFTVNTDTSDATHFNPGGAVRMAAKLANDIRASVPTIAAPNSRTHPVRGRLGTP